MRNRLLVLIITMTAGLFVLFFRLFQLQIYQGENFYKKSQRVIRKVVTFTAPRGELFDRHFKGREGANYLVQNTTKLSLIAIPEHFEYDELIDKVRLLEKVLGKIPGEVEGKFTKEQFVKKEEMLLIDQINKTDLSIIADYYLLFSKFIVKQNTKRLYNMGNKLSHVTGYIGPPDKSDIQSGIKSYQWVGKNGIEKYYDNILRGEDGEIVQIKTATGELEEQKVFKSFLPGNNLVLTIDAELQKAAWEGIGDKNGAVVVLKPATGEILALVSKPDFDPNILISLNSVERDTHLKEIQKNYSELNRAISAKYPPASTFKPIVTLAAMEEKNISASQKHNCPGKFIIKSTYSHLPDSKYHCWDTHRNNNMIDAIAKSCSVYFYKLGQQVGPEPIMRYSGSYCKLNKLTNIDLPGEIPGFIPTKSWKEKQYRQRWFDGDTVNLSIGQGFLETTLIGMVNFYASIATGGIVYKPYLVKEVRFAENDQLKKRVEPEVLYELPMSRYTLETIRTGIRNVVSKGTARWILNKPYLIPIAGKTGTVQTRSFERFANKTQHAWFIGYGPYAGDLDKTIVVGVFVEKGVGGSIGAAPVARNVFKVWSQRIKKNDRLK